MHCFVCGSEMKSCFHKECKEGPLEYVRCIRCGLVVCQTVYEMTEKAWESVNDEHRSYQGSDENPEDPNWLVRLHTQSRLFADLFSAEVFSANMRIVDYGCGDGKLSDFFRHDINSRQETKNAGGQILNFDAYMRPKDAADYLQDTDMRPASFDAVITCSVFEHLIGKTDVDKIVKLLNDNGTLCLHTLVCEEVPNDPTWFYLLAVHCTLWTNKSMGLLYDTYGFVGCAYHVEARMWFFFKNRQLFEQLKSKSPSVEGTWVFSDKFVDYWKQKPYR